VICYSVLIEGALPLHERSTTMAKIGFYVKAATLLLTLALSSLVGCAGSSFSAGDSDAGVTLDVTTGGSSAVSTRQSATGGQSSPQSSVVSQSTGGSSGGSSTASTVVMNRYYVVYSNSAITYSSDPLWQTDRAAAQSAIGTCARITSAVNYSIGCACIAGQAQVYSGDFSAACTGLSGLQCQGLSTSDASQYYVLTWECPATIPSSAAVAATGGSSAVAATGGSSAVAATGGSSAVAATGGSAPTNTATVATTYAVTYQNQVALQSVQAPGTCPSGQTITACTCVISGMQSTLTSCNPTACAIENSKQYPQSVFTWTCV